MDLAGPVNYFISSEPRSIKKLLPLFVIRFSSFILILLTIISRGKSGYVFQALPIIFFIIFQVFQHLFGIKLIVWKKIF